MGSDPGGFIAADEASRRGARQSKRIRELERELSGAKELVGDLTADLDSVVPERDELLVEVVGSGGNPGLRKERDALKARVGELEGANLILRKMAKLEPPEGHLIVLGKPIKHWLGLERELARVKSIISAGIVGGSFDEVEAALEGANEDNERLTDELGALRELLGEIGTVRPGLNPYESLCVPPGWRDRAKAAAQVE